MIVEDRIMVATHLDREGVGCLRIVGILQDAFEQMSGRERDRLRKKNVQSVTHTSTITTVYKDGRPPSVRSTSTRESPAPNQNSV